MSLKNEPITYAIKEVIVDAFKKLCKENKEYTFNIKLDNINVDKTKSCKYGDFTTNVVMSLNLGGEKKVDFAKNLFLI